MRILSNLSVSGLLGLNSVADANTDTDKFLVLDSSGIVRYRTGAELYSDIGAGVAAYTSVLQHTVKAGEALTKGQAVYVTSADGTNMIVGKASNTSEATSSKTLGLIVQNLATNDQGFVITEGLLAGLDTSTAVAGDPVWLGTDGNLIFGLTNKPYAPAHLVFIGIVTRVQQNNGEIFVKVQNGFELNEIHNVQITSTPSDNTVLAYEASTSLYKMKSIPVLLGYTPADAARTLTINGTSYDLSANRTWNVGTITGTGTSNYLAKWQSGSAIGNSLLYDTSAAILIGTQTAGSGKFMVYSTSPDNHYQAVGSAPSFRFADTITSPNYTGIFGLATASNHFIIGAAAGDMVLSNNTTSAIGNFLFGTGATERMRISPTGNVSINNTNNTYRFDVNGTVRFTGQLRLESTITDGTYTYTLPSATGTLALVGGAGVGTVTSIATTGPITGGTITSTGTIGITQATSSTDGYLSSTDWTTFNNKQNALTNPVTGTGTTNYLPKFTGTSTIGNSATQTDSTGNLMVGSANAGNAGTINVSVGVAGTTAGGLQLWAASNQTHFIQFGDGTTGAQVYAGYMAYAHSTDSLLFGTNGADKMTLTASGNLGLGVTPSAWGTFTALQVGNAATWSTGTNNSHWSSNTYYDGTNRIYIGSDFATEYAQQSGAHKWFTAPSGTAGGTITATQAMTLNASGNLSIGNTNNTYKLDVSGTGRFTGNVTVGNGNGQANIYLNRSAITSIENAIRWQTNGTNDWYLGSAASGANSDLEFYNYGVGAVNFKLSRSTGAATFSNKVTLSNGNLEFGTSENVLKWTSGNGVIEWGSAGSLYLRPTGAASNSLVIASTGAATFTFDNNSSGVVYKRNVSGTIYELGSVKNSGSDILYQGTGNVFINADSNSDSTATDRNVIFGNRGVEYARLTSSGNLSIGNNNNTYKLDVTGTGYFSGQVNAATYLTLSEDGTYTGTYYTLGFSGKSNGANRIFGARDGSDGIYIASATSRDINFRAGGGTTNNLTIASTGAATFSSSVTAGGNITGNGVTIGASDVRSSSNILTLGGTSEVIRIAGSTGNVGIGTTSPASKLSVVSSLAGALPPTSGTTPTSFIDIGSSAESQKLYIGSNTNSPYGFYLQVSNSTALGTNYPLLLNPNGGNVGIGTTSPSYGLDIQSASASGAYLNITKTGYASAFMQPYNDGVYMGSFNSYPVYVRTNNSTVMTLTTSGNVGIGTTSPGEKLTVNGKGYFVPYLTAVISGQGAGYYGTNLTLASDTGATQGANRIWSRYDGSGSPAISIEVSTTTQGYNSDPQTLSYSEIIRIKGNGNVGIGTTSPTQGKLVVSGGVANSIATIAASISGGSNALNIGDDGTNAVLGVANSGTDMVFLKRVAGVYSEAMRITSGGAVGIGNTNPSYILDVISRASGEGGVRFWNNRANTGTIDSIAVNLHVSNSVGQTGGKIVVAENTTDSWPTNMQFWVNGATSSYSPTEVMRITSGGNVGIGTSSPGHKLQVSGESMAILNPNSPSSTSGADAILYLGGNAVPAYIKAFPGDWYAQNYRLEIGTQASSTAQKTYMTFVTEGSERMRITSGGNLLVGTTSDNNSKIQVQGQVRTTGGYIFDNQTGSGNFTWYGFGGNIYAFNSAVGNIATINGSTGAYTATSDINKKKDFELSNLGLDAVMGLKPTLYRMKSEFGTQKHLGFIAQEVKDYIPQAYAESNGFIGLTEMPIIAALTKAVQEQQAQIEQLKSQLNK